MVGEVVLKEGRLGTSIGIGDARAQPKELSVACIRIYKYSTNRKGQST